MWDYLECLIVIMMDVFVDLVYGKVVFLNILFIKIYENVNWYYRYFKFFDMSDIIDFSDWCCLVILI